MDNFWVTLDLDTKENCFECNLKIYNELTRTFYLRYGTAMERFVFDTIRENSIQAIPESRYLTLNVKKADGKSLGLLHRPTIVQQKFPPFTKGHSFCKQCLHDLQFKKTRYSSPKVTFSSQSELTSVENKVLVQTLFTKRMDFNLLSQVP